MASLLKSTKYICRVSSVLNRDSKLFGKQHLFDGCDETCWNSDQGTPQWILIELEEAVSISTFSFQFQGGFAGRDCEVEGGIDRASMQVIEAFYPEDNNTLQSFKLSRPLQVKCIRFNFKSSTDFFGRIIVYRLEITSVDT
ncbi:hypothetical protein R5R35_002340 [Gryllus longicercus]|uniref:Nuclear receptor 2C2-associated protein n=1 Tax=Gryllus longicercus TaxID=2509291 RepID=A0AAN9VNG7_9ORTH|nr:Uncharacterized protein GBIM_12001 [Gryllus bimaculatus]